MKGKLAALTTILMFVCMLVLPAVVHAAPVEGTTTQGEFALWLVKEVGAMSKLPAAPTGQDAIDFLTELGIVPDDGWKQDDAITKEFLSSLLGDEEATGTFEELLDQVQTHVRNSLSDRNLGVFRASGVAASGSAPTA